MKIKVPIICTLNFLNKISFMWELFHSSKGLYAKNPLIKKNMGILKLKKKGLIPSTESMEKTITCQKTTNIIENPLTASK